MKKTILLLLLTISSLSFGQVPRIKFTYDLAGNQINRVICPNCAARNAVDSDYKNPETITEKDFLEEGSINYYPNPVREELYLNWKNKENNTVQSIELYNMNGQLLKSYTDLNIVENTTINFQTYTVGFYNLIVVYENGDRQILKIVKK